MLDRDDPAHRRPGARHTARVTLTDRALVRLRIAPHGMWDVVGSLALLARHRPAQQFPYRGWMRTAAARLVAGRGRALVRWAASWPPGDLPQFLLPVPGRAAVDVGDVPDWLRGLPGELPQSRLKHHYGDAVPAPYRRFVTEPEAAVKELADLVEEYVAAVLQPYRQLVDEILQDDVTYRARVQASNGIDELLNGLHPRVRWDEPELRIAPAGEAVTPRSVVLVPMVFARDRVDVSATEDGEVAIGFQARGAARLALRLDGLPARRTDRLPLLLGKTRSAVLRALASSHTTTALAELLDLAPSTVSEQLTLLVECRMAVRTRHANRVYYRLTGRGARLLRVVDEEESSDERTVFG